jgi:hypothetical protein
LPALRQLATIASVGQAEAQVPQSMHTEGSIQRASFFSLMALTGHSPSQAPQLTQASVTLYAMAVLLESVFHPREGAITAGR